MRIAVKNLPTVIAQEEIKSHFGQKGTVTDVFMLFNSKKVFRRVCFVGYSTSAEAELAVQYFNDSYFKNHKIKVEMAFENDDKVIPNDTQKRRALYSKTVVIQNIGDQMDEETIINHLGGKEVVLNVTLSKKNDFVKAIVKFKKGEDAENTLKTLKIISGKRVKVGNYVEKIIDAQKEHYSTIFFNFEMVVKRTCENENIDRKALLDLKDKDLGSRMALLETNLVAQTKVFLKANGICLDNIIGKSDRIVILRTSDLLGALELIKGDYKVNIAPSKCLALLIFKEAELATKCYKSLNMRRFKNDVIYCEYAPLCNFSEDIREPESVEEKKQTNKIIVKNVPFQATQEELKKIFSAYSHVSEVRLPKKIDGTHRGFAFIVLDSPKKVAEAIEYFGCSTHLYGRRLVLEKAKL
ncbi:putative RNA-binding protein 19 [Glugoides intestinalis]